MEWDTVVLLDTFASLTNLGPPGSYARPGCDPLPAAPAIAAGAGVGAGGREALWEWGGFGKDDVNLWYVAATRARRRLELPAQWVALERKMQARSPARPSPPLAPCLWYPRGGRAPTKEGTLQRESIRNTLAAPKLGWTAARGEDCN